MKDTDFTVVEKKDTNCPHCGLDWSHWQHEDTLNTYNTLSDGMIGELRAFTCECGATICGTVWAKVNPELDFELTQWDEPREEKRYAQYVHMFGGNGYGGCEFNEYLAFTEIQQGHWLDQYASDSVRDWAESYEYLATGWENDFEDDQQRADYYDNVFVGWEFCTHEEWKENDGTMG